MNPEVVNESTDQLNGIAIIGMAGRFPKADNIDEYWQNLVNGVECIAFYQDEELIQSGIDPEVLKNPDYVKAKGEVSNVDMFDASFFGINPREAEVTDPQHRMLLECAWEAMEHAGYDSFKYQSPIGIFAGKSMDYYLLLNVYPSVRREISAGSLQAAIGNDKDSLSTTISYRLNLTGPGISVQTSSSTSLVAVCVACQSLMMYQCDIALAGGITAGPPIKSGYLYQEGGIWDPEGHCRAFDAKAKGFVPGSGMGLVVLKRLEEAILDGDNIWAVIRGFAVNNDGSKKVSYSAPSVDAQAEVVVQAQAVADVHPETIRYIECHGTGTNMGDPIEVTALTQAFRLHTDKKHFCALGSVKTNIGHLDNAAGVAGLIKTALILRHRQIPPTLHFKTPNPKIDFENSPFFVNTQLKDWEFEGIPRRAGVTSLGMGGTNAHVILEEAPEPGASSPSRPWQLLLISTQTAIAMEKKNADLLAYFRENPGVNLADAAFTLQVGRRDFNRRRVVLACDMADACHRLEEKTGGRVFDAVCNTLERPVVFMFSGQGSQYVQMARELYEQEPLFKETVATCAELLQPHLGVDIREVIYPADPASHEEKAEILRQTWMTQPVLFTIEYALARLWMEWGVLPKAMIGHSIGEWAAACIAGCISLEDALALVALRGRLMHEQEPGAMLSIELEENQVIPLLGDQLSLAAVNSPKNCVVSGSFAAIEELEAKLVSLFPQIYPKRLHTSHAFHSPMMDPLLEVFTQEVRQVQWQAPQIPFISGLTGTWITGEEVQNPFYWARQLREAVRFSDGIKELMKEPGYIFLEVGPGSSLSVLVNAHCPDPQNTGIPVFHSVRHIKQNEPDILFILKTLGQLWLSGVVIAWDGFYKYEKRHHIPLPTYPFERKRYWLDEVKLNRPVSSTRLEIGQDVAGPGHAEVEVTVNKEEKKKPNFEPRPEMTVAYQAPVNDLQRKITETWEDILGIHPIGIQDNFFDLGGHSLLATSLLSRIQTMFGVRLELRVIFEEPTIASIAGLLEAELKKQGVTITAERNLGSKREEKPGRRFDPRPELPVEFKAPVDDLQRNIAGIWEDILGIRPVGIQDNFFDLGGHSLLATTFLARVQDIYHTRLELRVIFEEPTVAVIANLLQEQLSKTGQVPGHTPGPTTTAGVEDPYAVMTPAPLKPYYALSSAQERFYMMQHLDLDSRAYNMTGLIHVKGKLEKEQFEKTLSQMIQRHESLRTSIELIDSEPRQRVQAEVDFNVEYHSAHAANQEKSVDHIVESFIRPFDLTRAPLLRVGLIDLPGNEQVLMFDMHHIVSDGTSLSLLTRNFIAFYSGEKLPPMNLQYKDFCEWQHNLLTTGKLENEKSYWLKSFSGHLPVLNLPTDFPRPAIQSFEGDSITFAFDLELSRKVKELMRKTNTTLYIMLLALYNVILSKYSGQNDIIVGSPLAVGRNHPDMEPVIGLLIETLVIRNFPAGEKTFAGFLMEVRTNTLNAFENQAFPFGELVELVKGEIDRGRNPLFDAMLIVQNIEVGFTGAEVGGLILTPYQAATHDVSKVDINLEAEEKEGQVHFNLEYCTRLFKKETMERFAAFFSEIASMVVENNEIKLKDIKISLDLVTATSTIYEEAASQFEF